MLSQWSPKASHLWELRTFGPIGSQHKRVAMVTSPTSPSSPSATTVASFSAQTGILGRCWPWVPQRFHQNRQSLHKINTRAQPTTAYQLSGHVTVKSMSMHSALLKSLADGPIRSNKHILREVSMVVLGNYGEEVCMVWANGENEYYSLYSISKEQWANKLSQESTTQESVQMKRIIRRKMSFAKGLSGHHRYRGWRCDSEIHGNSTIM